MGKGERRGRRGRRGFRFRRRRVGIGGRRRRWRRGRGGGGALLVMCCIGAAKAIQNYRQGVAELEQEQKQILEQQSAGTAPPEENVQRVQELQKEQIELLNDIMERQAKEKDPQKLQELIDEQNKLIANMQQMQSAGYQYQTAIPPPTQAGDQQQQVPMEAATY